ncbi:MAG: ABC transporter ATP-binding protein [Oscillospiraceae bacterium]|nr:ABC transporter ATP-binding protein [Oscillospiraceae bacterium]
MLKIFRFMKKQDIGYALLCLLLVAGQVWFDLTMPDYMSDITKRIVTPGSAMTEIWLSGAKMLGCALGSAAMAVIVGYFAARLASNFSYTIREKVFHRVTDFGAQEIKQFSTASLITRTTNDITQIQMLVAMGLQVMIKAPIMAVWAVLKIVGKSWELSLLTAGAVVLILVVILILMRLVLPKFRIIQQQIDEVNRITRENLTGLRIVRAFNAEAYQEEKFETANRNLMETQLYTSRKMAVLMPFISMIMSTLSLGIYWLGASLVNNIPLTGPEAIAMRVNTFSEVVVFSSYAIYVVMSFMMLVVIFMMWPRAQVSAARIEEVLSTRPHITEGSGTEGSGHGSLAFRHVFFRYADASEDCLQDITFDVNPGETVAIIGSTGSSKSTLISLAARLYDATQGEILLDGKDIRDYTFAQLYRKVGLVTQKAVLFSGTVEENLTFGDAGNPISQSDQEAALDIAQASDFVENLPEKRQARIAQGGANLSGGQKQRLAIARTIARKPEILIFDDSFSALDFRTDAALRKRLATDLKGTTCLIVAQRIGTVKHADRIVVLEEGKAVGIGTHEELMKTCSVYREIALSQLSQAELEVG